MHRGNRFADWGIELDSWKSWRFGVEVSFDIQGWRPYLSLDVGPVHMFWARRKRRKNV